MKLILREIVRSRYRDAFEVLQGHALGRGKPIIHLE